jgi:hypothetical protein
MTNKEQALGRVIKTCNEVINTTGNCECEANLAERILKEINSILNK